MEWFHPAWINTALPSLVKINYIQLMQLVNCYTVGKLVKSCFISYELLFKYITYNYKAIVTGIHDVLGYCILFSFIRFVHMVIGQKGLLQVRIIWVHPCRTYLNGMTPVGTQCEEILKKISVYCHHNFNEFSWNFQEMYMYPAHPQAN